RRRRPSRPTRIRRPAPTRPAPGPTSARRPDRPSRRRWSARARSRNNSPTPGYSGRRGRDPRLVFLLLRAALSAPSPPPPFFTPVAGEGRGEGSLGKLGVRRENPSPAALRASTSPRKRGEGVPASQKRAGVRLGEFGAGDLGELGPVANLEQLCFPPHRVRG